MSYEIRVAGYEHNTKPATIFCLLQIETATEDCRLPTPLCTNLHTFRMTLKSA
jgi:hypothetical protein